MFRLKLSSTPFFVFILPILKKHLNFKIYKKSTHPTYNAVHLFVFSLFLLVFSLNFLLKLCQFELSQFTYRLHTLHLKC